MKKLAVVLTLAALTVLTGCGGDDPEETDTGTDPGTSSSAPATDEPSESSEPPAEGGGVLTATLGDAADPDAFVIALTDESGAPVSELPAGDYTINVTDPSTIHNFHLLGGSVDESTTVEEVTEVSWDVTLEPGEYTFKCDPHPPMTGSFTVA